MSKTDILNGDSIDDMLLSYYPSPYPSPAATSNGMRELSSIDDSVLESSSGQSTPRPGSSSGRRTMPGRAPNGLPGGTTAGNPTLRTIPYTSNPAATPDTYPSTSVETPDEVKVTQGRGRLPGGVPALRGNEGRANVGALPKPVYQGPKLRCRMCRRELAARDHVIEHEPGRGQMAFERRRREKEDTREAVMKKPLSQEQQIGARLPAGIQRQDSGVALGSDGQTEQTQTQTASASKGDPAAKEGAEASQDTGKTPAQSHAVRWGLESPPGAIQSPMEHPDDRSSAPSPSQSQSNSTLSGPASGPGRRPIQTAASLSARLPPHLAALRLGRAGAGTEGSAPSSASPPGSTASNSSLSTPTTSNSTSASPSSSAPGPAPSPSRTPMLHSSACSAYFVEPLQWMSALRHGEIAGRLECPGKRCGAKLGSWDWAGMQCGW